MQGQRSSFQHFCEAFEFDRASSSSNSAMDQQMFWNDFLHNSEENQDLPSNPLTPGDTNISCGNVASQENVSLSIWDPVGPSSSMPPLNQGSHDEIKLESSWTSSSLGRASRPRITDNRSEANNTLSIGNEDTELNSNHVNNGEPFSQFLNFHGLPPNSAYGSDQVLESGLHQEANYPGLMQRPHVSFSGTSSTKCESSSKAIDFFSNTGGGRQGVALHDQCSSHKRKNIEGVRGESSASGSSRNFSEGVNRAEEEINGRIGIITRVAASEHQSFSNAAGNNEIFQRNTRIRINRTAPANASTPNLWPQENSITNYNIWPAQPSSPAVPSNQLSDSRLVGSNSGLHRPSLVHTIPVLSSELYPFPQSGPSTTEVGSSSGSPAIAVGASGELNSIGISSNIPEQVFVPPPNTRHLVQDQTNWSLTSGSTVLSGNAVPTSQVATNIGVYQSPGANWVSHQHRRRISEAVRRSFFSSGSEPRSRSMSLPPRHGQSSTSQEAGRHQSGAISRGNQQPYMRSSNMLHRQNDGALGIPLPMRTLAAAREGRSRMSELRNVFDLIRRGDNLLLEDVLLFEQSIFMGGTNIHDRYRDMRLDVDNMSYEELLALGERIGNVNTGLSEEKILKCLWQRKYVSLALESSEEVEPCCICREEYVQGEELGRLDCGHDFHTACIKQWLMIKNLCPICKTTALST